MVISHLSDKIWYISDCGDNNGDEYGKAIIGNSCGCGYEGMIEVVLVLGTLDISDNDVYSCSDSNRSDNNSSTKQQWRWFRQ